jgi:hypothetical protein
MKTILSLVFKPPEPEELDMRPARAARFPYYRPMSQPFGPVNDSGSVLLSFEWRQTDAGV